MRTLRFSLLVLWFLRASDPTKASESLGSPELQVTVSVVQGQAWLGLTSGGGQEVWAEGPYLYSIDFVNGHTARGLVNPQVRRHGARLVISGLLADTNLRVTQELLLGSEKPWDGNPRSTGNSAALPFVEERITLKNEGHDVAEIADVAFGFPKILGPDTDGRHWVAVPFRRQVDGKLHDYNQADLTSGRFSNSDWRNDPCVAGQQMVDAGKLRSEAWAWTDGKHGLLVAKYNADAIEFSLASIERDRPVQALRFGGAGLALYREPRCATRLDSGQQVRFGLTRYTPFAGDWPKAYDLYRRFLDQKGHVFPADYNPPLNWNELFDVGWYHSDREQLFRHYTRGALLAEAAKARELGCDLLYLDPGWEICEGTTLWDEQRLGKVPDFARELRQRFGLKLGYRTIGRVYRDEFPKAWCVRRQGEVDDYERPSLAQPISADPVPLAAPDGRRNLALLPEAKARASSVISGFPDLHTVGHLNDGYYENSASWVSAGEPSWVELDLGAVYSINELVLGSEHHPQYNDRAITKFEVRAASEFSDDVNSAVWRKVLRYDGKPIHHTFHFAFDPVPARWLRVLIQAAEGSSARIDELEVYEAQPQTGGSAPVRRPPPKTPKGDPIPFWEVCMQSKAWQREKLKRILAITGGGVDFMMFDEFDWRGPCYDPLHGHPVPSTPEGHVRAIYGLVEGMRQRYPRVLVEAHDPVWPWSARYLPVYFRQGFTQNRYQENWGFEFMWNPIEDLRSGRALCLYYYNLGCDIPVYDHITMEGDNDACLAFWWYASTVRHLGIGGKKGLNSAKANSTRYAAYREAVAEYNRLRPFYARGKFIGLDETTHVHLHPTERTAVVNVFNLSGETAQREIKIEPVKLGLPEVGTLNVEGAATRVEGENLVLSFSLSAFSPAHAVIQKQKARLRY